jgi:hypothetical protein
VKVVLYNRRPEWIQILLRKIYENFIIKKQNYETSSLPTKKTGKLAPEKNIIIYSTGK